MNTFRAFRDADADACLAMFDSNVPGAFAPNERPEYAAFLDDGPRDYWVACDGPEIVGAFGFSVDPEAGRGRIRWILTHSGARGQGLGRQMMAKIREQARSRDISIVDIAASHVSAPFFGRYGAKERTRTVDGWGPGLDRVDMEWMPV